MDQYRALTTFMKRMPICCLTVLLVVSATYASDPCAGNGFATIASPTEPILVGNTIDLAMIGAPYSRVSVLVDIGTGPTKLPNIGTICLDLGPRMRILHDGIRSGSPRTGPDGRFDFSINIPDRPSLNGRTGYLQGLIRDDDTPRGYAISNLVELKIGPRIHEDFSTVDMRDDANTTALWNGTGECIGKFGLPYTVDDIPPPPYTNTWYPLADEYTPVRVQTALDPPGRPGIKLVGLSWMPAPPGAVAATYEGVTIRFSRRRIPETGCFDDNRLPPESVFHGDYVVNPSGGQWISWPPFEVQLPADEPCLLEVSIPPGGSSGANPTIVGTTLPLMPIAGPTFPCGMYMGYKLPAQYRLVDVRSNAQSRFYDSGIEAPSYLPPLVDVSTRNGSIATIEYQGGRDTNGDGQVDMTTTWSTEVDVADNYRFVRFRATLDGDYVGGTLPAIRSITIPARKR